MAVRGAESCTVERLPPSRAPQGCPLISPRTSFPFDMSLANSSVSALKISKINCIHLTFHGILKTYAHVEQRVMKPRALNTASSTVLLFHSVFPNQPI